jgi:small nuclear ribonucleoprotein (snRNP)-like protein
MSGYKCDRINAGADFIIILYMEPLISKKWNVSLLPVKGDIQPFNSIDNLRETKTIGLPELPIWSCSSVSQILSCFDQRINVVLVNNRKFIGTLKATDRDCNLVLSEAIELMPSGQFTPFGLIVIQGKHLSCISLS